MQYLKLKKKLTNFLNAAELEIADATDAVNEEQEMVDPLGLTVVDVELIHAALDDAGSTRATLQIRIVLWTLRVASGLQKNHAWSLFFGYVPEKNNKKQN